MTAHSVLTLPEDVRLRLDAAYTSATRAKRLQFLVGSFCLAVAILASGWIAEFDVVKLWNNADKFLSYFDRILHLNNGQYVWTDVKEWFWGVLPEYKFKWIGALFDTVLIAYVGTVLGAIAAVLLAPLASSNINASRVSVIAWRRFLEFTRSVPEVVFAMLFVVAFGLGAFAGIAALAIHTTGALGKLFSEAIENIDMKTVEGISSTGGGWWQTYRFAVLPQVLPAMTSYTLWRFEINVRSASIIGFVGAGGIGQNLMEYIRKFYYSDVSALLILIVLIVIGIDMIAERLRHQLLRLQTS